MRITFILLFLPIITYCQTTTITSTGNWTNSGIWSGGSIGDTPSENVVMNNSTGATIQTGESLTIGNFTANNNNSITVNLGGSLSLSPGSFLDAGNGTTITIIGSFTVNGNFTVNNNVTLIVTGSMIVTGTVDMGTNGDLNVSGALAIGGNFTGSNNTSVTVNGAITVAGNASVGNGSSLNGTGTFKIGGTCSGGTSNFCTDGQLPIDLIFFEAQVNDNSVDLKWATSSELNFDRFIIEKSTDCKVFFEVGEVKGHGTTNERQDYSLIDKNAFVGKSCYRLKEIDYDGYSKYFKTVAVHFSGEENFEIFPNPVTNGKLNLKVNFELQTGTEAHIIDLTGTVLSNVQISEQQTIVPIQFSPGTYFVLFQSGTHSFARRFVVK